MSKGNKDGKGIVSVITIKNGVDGFISDAIKRRCGEGVKINFVRQRELLNDEAGLIKLIKQCGIHGVVIVVLEGITCRRCLDKAASETEIPFGVYYRNNSNEWEGFFIEPSKKQFATAD